MPNLACATIPAQSSIPLGYIFGAALDLGFSTWSAVQGGGYIAQARVRHKLVQLGQRTASITRLFKAAFALWAHHLKYGLCGRA